MSAKQISTLTMSRDEWLARRSESIGASEAGAILGLNPYKSNIDVYLEKTQGIIDQEDNLNMWLGREMEDIIKKRFEEETGLKVRRDYKIRIDDELLYLTTNLDGIVIGENIPVEYKTAGRWDGEIPNYYFAQIQHQMMVGKYDHCYFVVLVLGLPKQFIIERYDRNDDFILNMRMELVDFWENNVLKGIPPEPRTVEDAQKLYRKVDSGSIIDSMPAEMVEKWELLTLYDEEVKGLNHNIKAIKTDFMNFMKDKEAIVDVDGDPLITWRLSKSSKSFDKRAFQKEHPELYKKYLVEKLGSRRFLIKRDK